MSQSGGIHQNPSHREGNNHLLRLVRHYESSLKSGHPFYFDVEDLEEIADYYIADGRASDGEAVVELGLKMHPCSSGLLLRRVRVLMVSGQLQRALRLLDSMPDASYVSSDVDALLTKGEILVRLSRVFEAEQVFEECVEAVRRGGNLEEYIDTCLTVSDIYIADSLYTRAIAYIRRVLEEDGDCQDALSNWPSAMRRRARWNRVWRRRSVFCRWIRSRWRDGSTSVRPTEVWNNTTKP